MPRNFRLRAAGGRRSLVRLVIGSILAANVVAALLLVWPWGGSAEDLALELAALSAQGREHQAAIGRLKRLVAKSERARQEGEKFLSAFFLDGRTKSSTILAELGDSAKQAGLKPRDHAFAFEPIEGSDNLSMMTISANYEGSYSDLIEYVNLLDRSPRFLILDNLQASPTTAPGTLSVRFRVNAFVRDSRADRAIGSAEPEKPAAPAGADANEGGTS